MTVRADDGANGAGERTLTITVIKTDLRKDWGRGFRPGRPGVPTYAVPCRDTRPLESWLWTNRPGCGNGGHARLYRTQKPRNDRYEHWAIFFRYSVASAGRHHLALRGRATELQANCLETGSHRQLPGLTRGGQDIGDLSVLGEGDPVGGARGVAIATAMEPGSSCFLVASDTQFCSEQSRAGNFPKWQANSMAGRRRYRSEVGGMRTEDGFRICISPAGWRRRGILALRMQVGFGASAGFPCSPDASIPKRELRPLRNGLGIGPREDEGAVCLKC